MTLLFHPISLLRLLLQSAWLALDQIWANKMRSILTTIGIIIGVGAVIATVADTSRWRVETTDLDEWSTARVKVGQAVKVTVNALANKVLPGKVTNIASQAVTLSTGEVSYAVTILLDPTDAELRWGMTAKVEFQKQ